MDEVVAGLAALSDGLYLALNGLSGRSWLFDALVALAIDNNLVKAAPVAAAFVFAWYRRGGDRRRARRALLATLASLLFVLVATKSIADAVFLPRPFILSEPTWQLEEGELVESPRLAYRMPREGFSHGRYERLRQGEIEDNDLASFPSDHAAFYFALALGIFFASRRAGAFALAWTLIVICGSRIVTGTHSPLDIGAGIAIGGAIVSDVWLLADKWLRRPFDAAGRWTMLWPGLSGALLFLAMFEAANTLENARDGARAAKKIVERAVGG